MRFRFTIRDLLSLILLVAAVLAAFQMGWDSSRTNPYSPWSDNARFISAINLLLLPITTAVCFFGRATIRRFAIGYTIFGWLYLLFVLHPIPLDNFDDRWLLSRGAMVGTILGAICGRVCHGLLPPPKENKSAA